ncbi:MAG: neuraminidase-like domain-containing protein [Saprospiraceae bacterium]
MPTDGLGQLDFTIDSNVINGAGTQFTSQIKVNDFIQAAGLTRQVTDIESDVKLTVSENMPFISAELSYQIIADIPPVQPPFSGLGIVGFQIATSDVTGLGSNFTKEFKVGYKIQVATEEYEVTAIASDTALTVAELWTFDNSVSFSVAPQETTKDASKYLPHQGTGTLGFTIDSAEITGTGTSFLTELAIGDQVAVADRTRTIIGITSDTQATVSADWDLITADASFEILPVDGLDIVNNFVNRTSITLDQLTDLFVQNLDKEELAANVADHFYINDTDEALPYLQTYLTNDPVNPMERIKGLSFKRLDRLSRFIRLGTIVGWSFSDLGWLFTAYTKGTGNPLINEALIEYLAKVKRIQEASPESSLIQLSANWHSLKTIGRGKVGDPQDLFDLSYNNQALLDGKNPYIDLEVPFDPFRVPVQEWTITDSKGVNGEIRGRLSAALLISVDDVLSLGTYVNNLINPANVSGKIPLDLDYLSWMYRLSQWAVMMDDSLDELYQVLSLQFYPTGNYLTPPQDSIPATVDTMLQLQELSTWLQASDLTVAQLNYIIKGLASKAYEPPYQTTDVKDFINELAVVAVPTQLQAKALNFEDITEATTLKLMELFQTDGMISELGLFKKYNFSFAQIKNYFPLKNTSGVWQQTFAPSSFANAENSITLTESAAVFSALESSVPKVLDRTGAESATLSVSYTANTDLSFLAPIFPEGEQVLKTSQVQAILTQVKKDIEHTMTILSKIEESQQAVFNNGMASFLATTENTIIGLTDFVSRTIEIPDYLVEFLTPIETAVSNKTQRFVKLMSQWALIGDSFALDRTSLAYMTSAAGKAHFNLGQLNELTLQNLQMITLYQTLEREFNDQDNELIDYFKLPVTNDCPDLKIDKLAEITGWEATQICTLINYFWPEKTPLVTNFDTIVGLQRMNLVFTAANKIGADIDTSLDLTRISHLPLETGGNFVEANWATYEAVAGTIQNQAAGKLGESFPKVNKEVDGRYDTALRNVLVPSVIWRINAYDANINTASDLYQYLLIDVEMSSCQVTSLIAEGIASVQLYMQRARMMIEPGVNHVKVPIVWWEWISSYRLWEVNRKIFLYPENYIEPSLRQGITPEFKNLEDNLLQNEVNKNNVKEPFYTYMTEVNTLGTLVHVGSYKTKRKDNQTGEIKNSVFLFGKTNTQPATYYFRSLDDEQDWSAWYKIDISINAQTINACYALGRLFIFWNEISTTQSSEVTDKNSSTQTVDVSVVKYSFYDDVNNSWVYPQNLFENTPINAYPGNYDSINNETFVNLFNENNSFWRSPYVLSTGVSFVGSGKVKISEGMQIVEGIETQFLREMAEGDFIWIMGERRVVASIRDNITLVVKIPWTHTAQLAAFKIVPSRSRKSPEPFPGSGTVVASKDLQNVDGTNTKFKEEFSYGDKIVIGDETRIVISTPTNESMLVDQNWQSDHINSDYTVIPVKSISESLLVMYGGNLATTYDATFSAPPAYDNPSKDSFTQARNEVNQEAYKALTLAKKYFPTESGGEQFGTTGDVVFGQVRSLNSNLIDTKVELVVTDYQYASETNPKPYGAVLNRAQALLMVTQNESALADNYWGNNIAGSFNESQGSDIVSNKKLLYYVDQDQASLINVGNQMGWFLFNNSDEAFLINAVEEEVNSLVEMALIEQVPVLIEAVSGSIETLNTLVISAQAYSSEPENYDGLKFKFTRLTTAVMPVLIQRLFAGGIDNLLSLSSQALPELPFNRFYPAPGDAPALATIPPLSEKMDFDGAFGLYFWEIFFHAPFLVADILNKNKKYSEAKSWLEYIFNPTIQENDPTEFDPENRYWRFLPFRSMERETIKEYLSNPKQIRRYNYEPFDPDAIAQYRPVAYAKSVVMKYIDNLIDWGDFLFAQDTRESITQATNLYVLANDLLGPKPQPVGEIPLPTPKNYAEIKAQYADNIPQFLIDLENTPEITMGTSGVRFAQVPVNKTDTYFCVPENADFIKYWDRVADRLFKIRHCMNIDGVVRSLALFAPPIDPRALLQAIASGGFAAGLANQFNAPIPYFKFEYLLEKAKNITSQLNGLGSSLLSALERKDAEALSRIQVNQERLILEMTSSIRENEILEQEQLQLSQEASLSSAQYRFDHYKTLIEVGISPKEQTSLDAAIAAMVLNIAGSITKTAATIAYAVPQVGSPFAMTYGGVQVGSAVNAASGVFEIGATISNYVAQNAATTAGYERRVEDWTLQKALAQFDETSISDQIEATKIRKSIAEQNLIIHQQNVKNNEELEAYYKDKFTNEELYQWLANQISNVYFQSYNLAFEMAKAAERAYQYQFDSNQTFINFGYWDSTYKGLGAGDGLMLALNQLESTAVQNSSRRLEIEKNISLLSLDPLALLHLQTTGECIINLNEKLFDYDFPGHYVRKIKTISLSIPAIIGPYQNIHATLTQLNSQIILTAGEAGLNATNYLLGGEDAKAPAGDIMRSNWWVNQQIALSTGVNDSGMFQLDFNDPRFLPFEGTGAVSSWKLSMPFFSNRINFAAISDVIIHLKYTARDGGESFRQSVMNLSALQPYSSIAYLSMSQMYASQWFRFLNDASVNDKQTLDFVIQNFVPPNITAGKLTGFYFKLDASVTAAGSYITFNIAEGVDVAVQLDNQNACSFDFKKESVNPPKVEKVLAGERTITFDLKDTPADLKNEAGTALDGTLINNIELILYYDGTAEQG